MRARITMTGVVLLALVTIALVIAAMARPSLDPASASRTRAASILPSPAAPTSPAATSSAAKPASATATPTPAPVRFAVVGDGISLADSPDFTTGRAGPSSWVTYASASNVVFAGGWAATGATTTAIAANVEPVDASVLVIMAGSNDVSRGVPFSQTALNLSRIVATVGAKKVVVSAIPPRNADPQPTVEFNASLERLASQQGWTFVDAPAGVRNGARYATGMSADGVQPTSDAARIIGAAIAPALAR